MKKVEKFLNNSFSSKLKQKFRKLMNADLISTRSPDNERVLVSLRLESAVSCFVCRFYFCRYLLVIFLIC